MSSIAKVSQQIVDQYNHYFQRGLSLSVFDSPSFPEFSQFPVTSQYFPFLASFCQRSGTYFRKWSYFLTKFCQLVSIFNTNDINSEPIAEIILPSCNHLLDLSIHIWGSFWPRLDASGRALWVWLWKGETLHIVRWEMVKMSHECDLFSSSNFK